MCSVSLEKEHHSLTGAAPVCICILWHSRLQCEENVTDDMPNIRQRCGRDTEQDYRVVTIDRERWLYQSFKYIHTSVFICTCVDKIVKLHSVNKVDLTKKDRLI